jgi:hypothetical protein
MFVKALQNIIATLNKPLTPDEAKAIQDSLKRMVAVQNGAVLLDGVSEALDISGKIKKLESELAELKDNRCSGNCEGCKFRATYKSNYCSILKGDEFESYPNDWVKKNPELQCGQTYSEFLRAQPFKYDVDDLVEINYTEQSGVDKNYSISKPGPYKKAVIKLHLYVTEKFKGHCGYSVYVLTEYQRTDKLKDHDKRSSLAVAYCQFDITPEFINSHLKDWLVLNEDKITGLVK